jgi:hypothetical protein
MISHSMFAVDQRARRMSRATPVGMAIEKPGLSMTAD